MNSNVINIMAIGDDIAGKTLMLTTYVTNEYRIDYIQTVFDHTLCKITVNGKKFFFKLWDTAGQEDYDRLRPSTYVNMDCYLLCYSIENRKSFANVLSKWYPELKRFSPNTPFILVGTKMDRRERHCNKYVTRTEAEELKQKIGAFSLVECSAEKNQNLENIFKEAVRATIKKTDTQSPQSRC